MNATTEIASAPADAMRLLRDGDFRRRVRALEPAALASLGYLTDPADLAEVGAVDAPEFKVVTSTRDTLYVQMPAAESGELAADDLAQIQAAGTAGSASSVGSTGSASTLGTLNTTASSSTSISSLGSAGSAGSAG